MDGLKQLDYNPVKNTKKNWYKFQNLGYSGELKNSPTTNTPVGGKWPDTRVISFHMLSIDFGMI